MALSTNQMARMNHLLDVALDLDEAGRRRWLEDLGEEDRDLKGALRTALLPGDEPALATLPKLLLDSGGEPGFHAGARVGPYELIRSLGRGGMAQVWLARRADGAYEREVALKLPVTFHLRGDAAKRFTRERDILAGLEHTGIARFYDAGISSGGLPYFAMEYVPGKSMIAWCDAARLGISDRLKLFIQVLEAVQYAHDRGVLHRDIKPSNVLVTESGHVRLLDFGVARMFQQTDTALTMEYGRALTPEYASPEQLNDTELGAPSDVYSLGVLLFQLLCGTLPYRLEEGKLPKRLPVVGKPSTRIDPNAADSRLQSLPRLADTLRGDLDAIVLKALAPDPAQRYPSAKAMARDLGRYLEHRPVLARPGTLAYRARKFVLRNRTATLAVLLGLTVAALGLSRTYGLLDRHAPTTPAMGDKSVAVLPFVDLSEHHDQEYFSDGLSEELIDRLSHSRNLRVISRTSSFYFKGRQATIAEIANTLHVSHVLEGSVRRSGQALRITAQLIRAADGSHLWSQTYDRRFADIFKVQEEIAGTVATSLKAALTDTAREASTAADAEAYNLVLQGIYFSRRNNEADWRRALEFFQKAVDLAPNYALAWARLGQAYLGQAEAGWAQVADGTSKARAAADHALKLDPGLALAHRTLAELSLNFDWDWKAARAQFQRARDLDPDDPMAALELAWLNGGMSGRLNESIEIEKRMIESDPLDTMARIYLIGNLLFAKRNEEAVASGRQLALLSPSALYVHANRAYALVFLGRPEEALASAQEEPNENWRLASLPVAFWALGRKAESDAALKELETKHALDGAYNIGEMHAYRGEIDAAFQWLERAYRQHDSGMMWMRVDPLLQNLRKDSRYQATLLKMKLDGEASAL